MTSRLEILPAAKFSLAAVLFLFSILMLAIVCWQPTEQYLLLVGVLAGLIAEACLQDFHLINPLLVATGAYALMYILPVSLGEYQGASSTSMLVSMGLAALHLGGSIGYLLMIGLKGIVRKKGNFVTFKINLLAISLLGFSLMGLVLVSWIANPALLTEAKGASQFDLSILDQLGALAAMLLAPLSVLVFVHFCNQQKVTQSYFAHYLSRANLQLVFFMLLPVIYDLLTAGRSHTVSAVLGWLVVYTVYVKRIPFMHALGVAFGLVLFSALMLVMRETMSSGAVGLMLAFEVFNLTGGDELLIAATQIGHQLRIFEEIVDYTALNGYQYGLSYLKTLLNVFPVVHIMYDDTFPVGVLYREHLAPNNVTGYDFSAIAEMYLQGGAIGIFLAQFLLGFVLACVYYNMYLKKSVSIVLLYSGLLFGTIWWYRSDLLNMMRYTENFFVVFISYHVLFRILAHRDRQGI